MVETIYAGPHDSHVPKSFGPHLNPQELAELGFELVATRGTAAVLAATGLHVTAVNKVTEGRPNVVDMIKNGKINLIINTVEGRRTAASDSRSIRTTAVQSRIPLFTTIAGARAACAGLRRLSSLTAYDLQSLHRRLAPGAEVL